MNYLITGITGFVGSHLAEMLLAKNSGEHTVWGNYRFRANLTNIAGIRDRIKLVECELTDFHSVYDMIKKIQPDRIYHLAAQSYVPKSWNSPVDTIMNNMLGQLNVFEAVRKLDLSECRILAVGSSEEYGLALPDEIPIKETNQLRPLSPYGVSKVGQDMMGFQYNKSYKMKIIRTRAFNHEGPRRGEVFVTSNFAKQIAEIEAGLREPVIYVGNLEAKRDFTDVRDVIRAYHDILEQGEFGEVYNICSGKQWSIQQVLDLLLTYSTRKIEVRVDPDRLRPSDVQNLLGDNSRIRERIHWEPVIPFEQTLQDTLNYWRDEIKKWKAGAPGESGK